MTARSPRTARIGLVAATVQLCVVVAASSLAACGAPTTMCWDRAPVGAADRGEPPNWPRLDALPDVSAPARVAGEWPERPRQWRVEGSVEAFQCGPYALEALLRSGGQTERLRLSPARTRFPLEIGDRVVADHRCTTMGCQTELHVNGALMMASVSARRIGGFVEDDVVEVAGWRARPANPLRSWPNQATLSDLVVTRDKTSYRLGEGHGVWTKVRDGFESWWIAGSATSGGECAEGCNAVLYFVAMRAR